VLRECACVLFAAGVSAGAPGEAQAPTRVYLDGTGFHGVTNGFALSPDGRQIAYLAGRGESEAGAPDGPGRLYIWIKPVDGGAARRLTSDQDPEPGALTFSPDGGSIAFSASDETLRRMPISGGQSAVVCKARYASGVSWTADDHLVYILSDYSKGNTIRIVRATGGTPETLVQLAPRESVSPAVLVPESRALLFVRGGSNGEQGALVAQPLGGGDSKVVVANVAPRRFFLAQGHIIYQSNRTGFAAPFDPKRLETTGPPVVIVEGLQSDLEASPNGAIAYDIRRERPVESATIDRNGVKHPITLTPANARVSPDGIRIAFVEDGRVWIAHLGDPTSKRQLTEGDHDAGPVWTPDGRRITYLSNAGTNGEERIASVAAEGGNPETVAAVDGWPEFWSRDGRLGYTRRVGDVFGFWMYSVSTKRSTLIADLNAPTSVSLSPDGKWIAYELAESDPKTFTGHARVFVRPFHAGGSRVLVTKTDARLPMWSPDGRQLFVEKDGQLLALSVRGGDREIAFGDPVALPITGFAQEYGERAYDIMPDGKSFLMSFYIPGSVIVVRDALRGIAR
jgi:Tol biopolymer transport system component